MSATIGGQYRLRENVGNEDQGQHLQAGWVATVEEMVEAATPGAHNSEEDCYVVSFSQPVLIEDDQGIRKVNVARRWACGVGEFDRLFEPVAEAAPAAEEA